LQRFVKSFHFPNIKNFIYRSLSAGSDRLASNGKKARIGQYPVPAIAPVISSKVICMDTEQLGRGLIRIHTGKGKGKTTTALGLAMQAVGQGLKVFIIQFLKGRDTGESRAAARLAPELTLRYFGRPGLINARAPSPEDLALVHEGWSLARQILAAGEHDLVILDEIIRVIVHGFVTLQEVLDALSQRPPAVEVVLTGRQAPDELISMADVVTEMYPVKHYFQAGVRARRGIEW
jgi:cob(I)alamin adenosyltransferase